MADTEQDTGNGPPGTRESGCDSVLQIDIAKLAEKVYRLMLAETRLARARGETVDPRRMR
jgi:hypothetical protein